MSFVGWWCLFCESDLCGGCVGQEESLLEVLFVDSGRFDDEICGMWIWWLVISRFCYGVV
jgi:hypothetical protein